MRSSTVFKEIYKKHDIVFNMNVLDDNPCMLGAAGIILITGVKVIGVRDKAPKWVWIHELAHVLLDHHNPNCHWSEIQQEAQADYVSYKVYNHFDWVNKVTDSRAKEFIKHGLPQIEVQVTSWQEILFHSEVKDATDKIIKDMEEYEWLSI